MILLILGGCQQQKQLAGENKAIDSKKISVFLLAGQSNMEGRARAYNLTPEDLARLESASKQVTLYYNHQDPVPLQVTTPGKHIQEKFETEQVFGPELFFGINLAEAYPGQQFIFIKRSKGGTSLYGAWNPDWTEEKAKAMNDENIPPLYDDLVAYAKSVLSQFDETEYELRGMLWVQGESDSGNKKFGSVPADTYEENLKKLISGIRSSFSAPELPFLIFQVGNGKVVQAMKNTARQDKYVSLIPQEKNTASKYYFEKNPPPIGHYTCESMKKIGTYFFNCYQENYANSR